MHRITSFVAALVLCFGAWAADEDHAHHHDPTGAPTASDAPIQVTINPEARITVKRGGAMPSPSICGTPTEVAVKIVNQALITARLQAELVGSVPTEVLLEFPTEPLKGVAVEARSLRIILTHPAPTDLTVAFRAEKQIPNFGGADRAHMVPMRAEVHSASGLLFPEQKSDRPYRPMPKRPRTQ